MMKFLIFHGADYSRLMEEDDYGYNYDPVMDHDYEDYCYENENKRGGGIGGNNPNC